MRALSTSLVKMTNSSVFHSMASGDNGYATSQQRYNGEDALLLAQRDRLYQSARVAKKTNQGYQIGRYFLCASKIITECRPDKVISMVPVGQCSI